MKTLGEILSNTEGFCHFYYARNLGRHRRLLSFLLREKSWATPKAFVIFKTEKSWATQEKLERNET
ncbi:MAG TPA: hypothetical protein ENG03_07295 [Thioploca sp.]|nr:hypothetical protein [Thioploca sp.]